MAVIETQPNSKTGRPASWRQAANGTQLVGHGAHGEAGVKAGVL